MSHCWNASLTALQLESPPPTCVRNGHPVHAGDVVLHLASLWLRAGDAAVVLILPVRSQNGYPARTLHEVTSWVLRRWDVLLPRLLCNLHISTQQNGVDFIVVFIDIIKTLSDKLHTHHLSAEWYDFYDCDRGDNHRASL